MSYGLQVFGGNGLLQIDSDVVGMSGYGLKEQNTLSSVSYSFGDLIFVQKNVLGSAEYCFPDWLGNTVVFKDGTGAQVTMNYIVIGVMSGNSLSSDGSSYGLQVLDSAGNTAFDSRKIGTGVALPTPTRYIPSGTLVSGGTIANGSTEWVCINFGEYEVEDANDKRFEGLQLEGGLMKYWHVQSTSLGQFSYGQSSDILIAET